MPPEILYDIEANCIDIYDAFTDKIFPDRDKYYDEMNSCPLLVYRWGLDSDFFSSKDEFNQFIQDENTETYFPHLFLADCHNLMGNLQNRINSTSIQLNNFLAHLEDVTVTPLSEYGYFWATGECVVNVFAALHDLIITMYASFDLISKIAYQLENMPNDYNKYHKLKCKNILYGHKNRLKNIDFSDTIFESCEAVNKIESMRHDLIHNGTWEFQPKVHYKAEKGEVVDKWILQPDYNESGRFETVNNRNRFYSKENRINITIIPLIEEYWSRVNNTLINIKKI